MKHLLHQRTLARLTLSMLLALFSVVTWGDELTVYDGTVTTSRVPAYIFYFDDFTKSQVVIPAEDLEAMAGGTISSMTFYTTNNNIPYTAVSSADVFLKEVNYTTISAFEDKTADATVFTGYFEIVSDGNGGGMLTIEFSQPYHYNGGNLLIGIENTEDLGYKSIYFYGQNVTGASIYGNNATSLDNISTGTQVNFIPKTTFTYSLDPDYIPVPTNFRAVDIGYDIVSLFWEGGTGTYNVYIKKADEENWTMKGGNMTGTGLTINFLEPSTTYNAGVESIDVNGKTSAMRTLTFTTADKYLAPTDLTVKLTPGNGSVAELSWTENSEATSWDIAVEEIPTHFFPADSNPYTLEGLTPETTYHAKVRSVHGTEHSAWSEAVEFTPTDTYSLTVNEGTNTNSSVPVYGNWVDSYTKSQFIIPAENLEDILYANISKLAFHAQNGNVNWAKSDGTLPLFKVYVAEVDETAFSGDAPTLVDWETLDNVYEVYEGTLAIVDHQMEIEFTNQYQYLGRNLLIGIEQTQSAGYSFTTWYGVETQTNTAIGGYNTSLNFHKFLPETTFIFEPGEAPACLKPTGLTVENIGANSATISWTSNEPDFDLMVNQEIILNVTNPYTLKNLQPATNYTVSVHAKNESGTSDWSAPVTFNTDFAEEKCLVTLELTDSYGDGWNGNAIQVTDVETGIVIATATIEKLTNDNTNKNATVDVYVPDGREIQFSWVSGSYTSECSYVVYDLNGDIIFEGSDALSEPVNHVVDCSVTNVKTPTNVTVSDIVISNATVDWTENGEATEWVVAYWTANEAEYLHQFSTTMKPFTLTNLTPETEYTVAVRPVNDEGRIKWSRPVTFTTKAANYNPIDLAITDVTAYSADVTWTEDPTAAYELQYSEMIQAVTPIERDASSDDNGWYYYDNGNQTGTINNDGAPFYAAIMVPAGTMTGISISAVSIYDANATTGTIYIYNDGDTAPKGESIGEQEFKLTGTGGFVEIEMPIIMFDNTKNLWVVIYNEGGGALANCANTGDINGTWLSLDGTTWESTGDYNMDKTWMIRVQESNLSLDDLNWSTLATGIHSPYAITGLTPTTEYIVRLRNSQNNNWKTRTFTTLAADAPPADLAVEAGANSVTVSWSGFADSYNIRYRKADFADGFEKGLGNWDNIDFDGDEYSWGLLSDNNLDGAHSGNDAAYSASYVNNVGAKTPENYLISPKVTLGGMVAFYAKAQDEGYPEEVFGVFASTEEPDPDYLVEVQKWTMQPNGWQLYTADLSNFAGEGYVAICHYDCTDQYWLVIDDVCIFPAEAKNSWTTLTTTNKEVTLTGLTPESGYLFEIEAVYSNKTSEKAKTLFLTTESSVPTAIVDISADNGNDSWYSIDGKKLNERPTAKGLYIRNGQKVVVK